MSAEFWVCDVCRVASSFTVVFIPTAFFVNLLCSWVEVLKNEMVKGRIWIVILYFLWIHAYVNTSMHLPCHGSDILKAEHNMDCICYVDYMSSMQENWDSFPPLKLNEWSI